MLMEVVLGEDNSSIDFTAVIPSSSDSFYVAYIAISYESEFEPALSAYRMNWSDIHFPSFIPLEDLSQR